YILQVLLMFGIFFTPVFIEPAFAGPRAGRLLWLNPLSSILEGLRLTMVEGANIAQNITGKDGLPIWTPWHLWYTTGIAVVIFVAGLIAFRRSASMFAEYY